MHGPNLSSNLVLRSAGPRTAVAILLLATVLAGSAVAAPAAPTHAAPSRPTPGSDEHRPDDRTSNDRAGPEPLEPATGASAGSEPEPPPIAADRTLAEDDVERTREDARQLRDALFKAHARVTTIAGKLFHSRISMQLRSNVERFYEVGDFLITLDGAPVYRRERGLGPADAPLFDVFAAPGSHELGISANLIARRDRTYTIRIEQTFAIVVPERTAVSTRLSIRETGDMWRFGKRGRGRYDARMILRVRAKPNEPRRTQRRAKVVEGPT